jgi:hypothetical protein
MNYQRFSTVLIVGFGASLSALVAGFVLLRLLPDNLPDLARVSYAAAASVLPILAVFLYIRYRLAQLGCRRAVSRRLEAAKASCSVLLLASNFATLYFGRSGRSSFALLFLGLSFLLVVALFVLLRVSWPWKSAA